MTGHLKFLCERDVLKKKEMKTNAREISVKEIIQYK